MPLRHHASKNNVSGSSPQNKRNAASVAAVTQRRLHNRAMPLNEPAHEASPRRYNNATRYGVCQLPPTPMMALPFVAMLLMDTATTSAARLLCLLRYVAKAGKVAEKVVVGSAKEGWGKG